MRFLGYLQT